MNEEELRKKYERKLYKAGGWELDDVGQGIFILELPLDMGKIYFDEVKELNKINMDINDGIPYAHQWQFKRDNNPIFYLSSNTLPRKLKDIFLSYINSPENQKE